MQTIYIETYGCSNNIAESEIIGGILQRAGFEITKNIELADIVILNTCGVKETTIKKNLYRIEEILKKYKDKKIIVSGCLPEIDYNSIKKINPEISIVSTNHITKILESISRILKGETVEYLGHKKEIKISQPRIFFSKVTRIIPICSGCNSFCYFCATKLAKGNVFSYPKEKIINEIKSYKQAGIKEFYITGQDVSCYGMDKYETSKLPELLNDIIKEVKGKYFIRVGMMNLKNLIKISNKLLKVYRSENIYKFLHLPIQSGSNIILKKMNREYTKEEFLDFCEKFRRHLKEINIWTDVIIGYPGETEKDFLETIEVIKILKPDKVNISKFSLHKGTPSYYMKQVDSKIKSERSKILYKIVREISKERNNIWLNWEGEILINNITKKGLVGRNYAYKPVIIENVDNKKAKEIFGNFVKVKIVGFEGGFLKGELLNN